MTDFPKKKVTVVQLIKNDEGKNSTRMSTLDPFTLVLNQTYRFDQFLFFRVISILSK